MRVLLRSKLMTSRKWNQLMYILHYIHMWFKVFFILHYVCFPLKLMKVICLIQDVVSPHCGDKGMERRCTISSLSNYFVMTSCHRNAGQCKQRKQSDYLLFIYSYYVSRMHGYVIISNNIWIFPVTVQFTFLQKKRCIEKLKVIKRYRDIDEWTETNNWDVMHKMCTLLEYCTHLLILIQHFLFV
jgi:hypothetical protein